MGELSNHPDIIGWGADLDKRYRPGVPMEKRPPNGTGAHWEKIEPQIAKVKVLHSIERPGITPVFGTSTPPAYLSGLMRQYAFRFSEARMAHWMTLLMADRVNVVEGLVEDLMKGKIPDLWKEMGLNAEFKHHPKALVRRAAVMVGIFGLATAYYIASRRNKKLANPNL